jgi:hypothetical protein
VRIQRKLAAKFPKIHKGTLLKKAKNYNLFTNIRSYGKICKR